MYRALISCCIIALTISIWGCARQDRKTETNCIEIDPQRTPNSGDVIARVGEMVFTEGDIDGKIGQMSLLVRRNYFRKENRRTMLKKMVDEEMFFQAALRDNYHNRPEIQEYLRNSIRDIIITKYYREVVQGKPEIPEDKLRAYYESHKSDFEKPPTAAFRHILVDTQKEALQVLDELNAGTDFSAAAKKYSKDQLSKNNGGKVGPVTKGGYVQGLGKAPALNEQVFLLEIGKLSKPIKSEKGFHIVIADSRAPAESMPFDQAKNIIGERALLTEKEIKKYYEENKDKYTIRAAVKISHIQFDKGDRDLAEQVRKSLLAGSKWDKMVRKYSKDDFTRINKSNPGDLDWIHEDGTIRIIGKDKEFKKAAFAMSVDELSPVIESRKGLHILKCTDKTGQTIQSLEEVRETLVHDLLRSFREELMDDRVENIRKSVPIEMHPELLKDRDPDDPLFNPGRASAGR